MEGALSQVKGFVGLEGGPGEGGANGNDFNFEAMFGFKLSKKTRIIGFASCLGIGLLLSIVSFFSFANPTKFAVLYTVGNIVALLGTGFLVGFLTQLKAMCAAKRIIATILYVVSLIGTLLAVFLIPNAGAKFFVAILCILIQFCCLVWYTASYIPFAQQFLKGMCG
eukprot:Partr_v1_DN3028_c0_g1_i1_m24237 putative SFT2 domain containing